jgi:acyl-CoA synthetase (AMP-forming)/AMP-acid ligase II
VEAVLEKHPAIAECAVMSAADAEWGQVPVAFVVLRQGEAVTADELRASCEAELARFKIPKEIRFVSSLPRNAAGKLLRHSLAWRDD